MVWRILGLPFRLVMMLSKRVLVALLLLAVVLAFAAVSSPVVFAGLSSIVRGVAPDLSIEAQQERLLAAARGRVDAEKRRADAALATAADLKDRNAMLSQNNDALTATNTALKQQSDKLTQANAALTAETKALQADLSKAKVVPYLGRTIPIADAVTEAAKRLSDRITAAAARSMAAAPGQAVPFYGIPVIAAQTRANLTDDCAALHDLRNLALAFDPSSRLGDNGVCALVPPTPAALWAGARDDAPAVWAKLAAAFDGLPKLVQPAWWRTVMVMADELLTPMADVTAKP
ncbi:MAG: hypothetical protein KGK00_12475 [Paracoccaceae bacterium]|nr:hypothetical protein [Paracoccaceae bacterium]